MSLTPNALFASLPMYDHQSLQLVTDAFWQAIRDNLQDVGIDAPTELNRAVSARDQWLSSNLLLSQTCGFPYVCDLRSAVQMVGSFDHGLSACAPGWYNSVFVVRADDDRETLQDYQGSVAAYNSIDSQSGVQALLYEVHKVSTQLRFFSEFIETGAHVKSLDAVARGDAQIASLDAVTWAMAQVFSKNVNKLRVLQTSEPTPALPLITGMEQDVPTIQRAVEKAVVSLSDRQKQALHIVGFINQTDEHYELIAQRAKRVAASSKAHGLLYAGFVKRYGV